MTTLVATKTAAGDRGPGLAWTDADTRAARADTPGTAQTILLDSAGASPSPESVRRRMEEHLALECTIGGYAAQKKVQAELDGFYDSVAGLIGAQPHEIAFAEHATRAWDMAFYGIAFAPGDVILTGASEYASNYLAFLQVRQQKGVVIDVVPDGPDGTIDVGELRRRLTDKVRFVNICHAPTSNGLLNDARAVGEALKGHPAIYALDACQSVGQIAIDVREIGCHVLSATGRKFLRGPRGTGFLYVADAVLDQITPPFADLRSTEWEGPESFRWSPGARRFESWEQPIAAKLALKCAVDYARAIGLERIEARIGALANLLRTELAAVPGLRVEDRGARRSGIVAFSPLQGSAADLRGRLAARGIQTTLVEQDSAPLDLGGSPDHAIVRAAPHYFNTEAELRRFAQVVAEEVPACA